MSEAETTITVADLTRRFPRCEALGGISFQAFRGEILGLLGPNGSGKTTTLRILAAYLAPTSGRAVVAGHDVTLDSLAVRKRIGYLPENVPLYPEMRVDEYLTYRGRLRGLRGKELAGRRREVIDQCGLGDCSRRIIGTLSRGFRQRTGLADCLLHRPDILLLDEPLATLDAARLQQMRPLLREWAATGTILFSTHMLAEAEQICDRVLILNAGRIAALDAPNRILRDPGDTFETAYLRLTAPPTHIRNPAKRSAE